MNKCVVLYEDWQLRCCGHDFEIGNNIKWLVQNVETLNIPIKTDKIDYCYQAHDSDYKKLFVLEGTIKQIKALYKKYKKSDDNPKILVPFDGTLVDIDSSKERDVEKDDMDLSSYLVYIENYSIRPALQSEVTFK